MLGLVDTMELWAPGKPKPRLPDFPPVAQELIKRRKRKAAPVDVLAANAADQPDVPGGIEAFVAYRAAFADGGADTFRLVVRLAADGVTLGTKTDDAFFF